MDALVALDEAGYTNLAGGLPAGWLLPGLLTLGQQRPDLDHALAVLHDALHTHYVILAGLHHRQRPCSALQQAVALYMLSCHAVAATHKSPCSAGLKGGFYAWYRVFDNKVGLL